ncbi:hypothetical protein ERICV_03275 [Paenibacillus larvae subsp. larvae]|uniref:Uncharacterized protein n=1 Tax=Paenibacillus larvae subsp. larvae TaxID=147375 RepID=A0A6C0QVB8_9BACL|nr:hypothetical protein ERICV_03275 [Paenibacillus larvae subsp. larvae]
MSNKEQQSILVSIFLDIWEILLYGLKKRRPLFRSPIAIKYMSDYVLLIP